MAIIGNIPYFQTNPTGEPLSSGYSSEESSGSNNAINHKPSPVEKSPFLLVGGMFFSFPVMMAGKHGIVLPTLLSFIAFESSPKCGDPKNFSHEPRPDNSHSAGAETVELTHSRCSWRLEPFL